MYSIAFLNSGFHVRIFSELLNSKLRARSKHKNTLNVFSSLIPWQMKPKTVRVYKAQNDSSALRYFITSEKNLTKFGQILSNGENFTA